MKRRIIRSGAKALCAAVTIVLALFMATFTT